MTDPVIPEEAVDAARVAFAKALQRTCGSQTAMRHALAAALPHLRPLFEVGTDDAAARWALLYSDAVDNGNELAQELRQDLEGSHPGGVGARPPGSGVVLRYLPAHRLGGEPDEPGRAKHR